MQIAVPQCPFPCPHKQTQGYYSNKTKNNNNYLNIPFDFNHPNKSKHDQMLRKVLERNVLVLYNVHQYKKQWFLDFFFFFPSLPALILHLKGGNDIIKNQFGENINTWQLGFLISFLLIWIFDDFGILCVSPVVSCHLSSCVFFFSFFSFFFLSMVQIRHVIDSLML